MKLVVGICGSIASYRSPDLVKELVAAGHSVKTVLTRAATQFVSPTVLETFSGERVLDFNVFSPEHLGTDHIATARWADAFIIYGATADFLAKLACGIADDFLLLQLSAFQGSMWIVPAMNPAMWENPTVQKNVQYLKTTGAQFIGPIGGKVACGETGVGHVAGNADILKALLGTASGSGATAARPQRVLLSVGAMRSALDPVRYIQNRSSGKMGLALAEEFSARGNQVHILLGPVDPELLSRFSQFEVTRYEGPSDYLEQLEPAFKKSDVFLSLAAVLDFEFLPHQKKIGRSELKKSKQLNAAIRPVPDCVAKMASLKKKHQKVIAFAAETGVEKEILKRAEKKLREKKVDALVANPVWPGLGPNSDQNQLWVLKPGKKTVPLGPASKTALASPLLDALGF